MESCRTEHCAARVLHFLSVATNTTKEGQKWIIATSLHGTMKTVIGAAITRAVLMPARMSTTSIAQAIGTAQKGRSGSTATVGTMLNPTCRVDGIRTNIAAT